MSTAEGSASKAPRASKAAALFDLRTVIAVLHDLNLVRDEFPETLMLARDCLGWGPTAEVLTAANRLRARAMAESWAADPEECGRRADAQAA